MARRMRWEMWRAGAGLAAFPWDDGQRVKDERSHIGLGRILMLREAPDGAVIVEVGHASGLGGKPIRVRVDRVMREADREPKAYDGRKLVLSGVDPDLPPNWHKPPGRVPRGWERAVGSVRGVSGLGSWFFRRVETGEVGALIAQVGADTDAGRGVMWQINEPRWAPTWAKAFAAASRELQRQVKRARARVAKRREDSKRIARELGHAGPIGAPVPSVGTSRPRARKRVSSASVTPPKWLTKARRAKLGTVPDGRIALAAGVHPSTVGRWRRKLGIPGFCPSLAAHLKRRK